MLWLPAAGKASAVDGSVAFQVDPAHDGLVTGDSLRPPLARLWTRDLGGTSYTVIAGGRVFAFGAAQNHSILYALDERTGATLWSRDLAGWSLTGPAYDGGKLFTTSDQGIVEAFAADSGERLWSTQLTGNYSVSAPPTADQGVLFVAGSNTGGTLFAIDETSGDQLWSAPVMNGDSSSPAIARSRVFVAYVGPQVYAFDSMHGTPVWHYSGCCEGGGGWAPAVYADRVYARDPTYGNEILDAASGKYLGTFDATAPPAFYGSTGLFLSGSTLTARELSSGDALWSFSGDGQLDTAPIVVNGTAYIGSAGNEGGHLYAVDIATGKTAWSDALVGGARGVDERARAFGALSAGDGLLTAQDGPVITAYTSAAARDGDPPGPGDAPSDPSAPPTSSGSGATAPDARGVLATWAAVLRRDAKRVIRLARHSTGRRTRSAVAKMRTHLTAFSDALRHAQVSTSRENRLRAAIRLERTALTVIARNTRTTKAKRTKLAIEKLARGARSIAKASAGAGARAP
jgi:outer membrane protein assembly factor BamB